ncbi:glycosyltransferase family 4 protein [Qipengyuania sp. GH1]|uniref:glycosyltransferase family 4 protein n=1 Tax=Qipengyuania aestuarii TaxID=2867241 RepID=UPI001C8721DE|nr:glycosyltransferase family 4 protein [Qipengyuania aestuarii]MBX7535472.1 glycosyltransferase family 4 protein [Qipengyuania aestuarii]
MGVALRICITVNSAWNIWNFRLPLIQALLRDGHEVVVLAPADECVRNLESTGCRFEYLPMDRKGLNPFVELRFLWRIARKFREIKPDLILGFTVKNNVFGALVAAWLKIPFVPNVTGLGTAFMSSAALRAVTVRLYSYCFRHCPHVFFQNEDDQALFIELRIVDAEKTTVLPGSGIDLRAFPYTDLPHNNGGTKYLMISRLLRDKGVIEYVEAAKLVKPYAPDIQFLILGDFDAENRTAISRHDLENWQNSGVIKHLGRASDVRGYIAQVDCIVLPSYREGAPRTLIEAAAMGRPIVSTDVPGCRSVVDEGKSGYLCEARSPRSLADAILRFESLDQEARARMGRAGRQKMEREFSVDKVIAAYRRVVELTTRESLARRGPLV